MKEPTLSSLKRRIKELESQVEELLETMRAIQSGEVDALVVDGPGGNRIFTLQGAEQPYRELVEAMNEGAATMTAEGLILYCNAKFASMAGIPIEQIVGSNAQELFCKNGQTSLTDLLNLGKNRSAAGEIEMINGTDLSISVKLSISKVAIGDSDGFCIIVTDLIERKLAEAKLRKANESLELRVQERTKELTTAVEESTRSQKEIIDTLDSMSDAFFAIDKNWKIIRANAYYEKMTGEKREDQIGKDLRELYFSDPIYKDSKFLKSYNKAMADRVFIRFEDYYEPRNLWTEVRVYPKSDGGLAIFFTDIGERVEIEKRLATERKKLKEIFYGADFPMVLFRGPELIFEMANQKYLELVAFRDILGKSLATALPEIAGSEFPRMIKRVHDTGEPVRFLEGYTPILNPNTGKLEDRYFDTTFARISEGTEREFLVVGNAMDVTERVFARKQIEERTEQVKNALREAQINAENLKGFFMQSPIPMVILEGPEHRFTLANTPYEKFAGKKVVGKTVLEVFTREQIVDFLPLMDSVYNTGVSVTGREMPIHFPDANGILRNNWVDIGYYPFRNSDGGIKGVLAIVQVVTDHVQARKQLEESAQSLKLESHKLETVFQETPAAMALWKGSDFVFEKVNPQYQAIFADRDLIGKPFLEACPEFVGLPFYTYLKRVFETGLPHVGKEVYAPLRPLNRGPLEDRYYDFTYLRINDAEGRPYGVYDHAIDVTEKVKSRKELESAKRDADRAKAEAEHANELKSAFLANMSHEIRTPLGAMLGFADLLRDPGLSNSERSNFIDILARNGDQLSVIINDILDLSKVEAGHLTLEFTGMEPDKVAQDALSLLRVKAKEKNLTLEYFKEETTPRVITSDPTRVRQVLLNLIANAVKFTKFGSVTLRSYGSKTAGGRDIVSFEIIDTGIGFTNEQAEKIFEAFVQADGSMTRRFGGTGLGLALSRQLARALGGDVTVLSSEPNVGTKFLFQIKDQPHRRVSESGDQRKNKVDHKDFGPSALKGVKVLVVDDSPDNQQLIWRFLSRCGAIVDSAENGVSGCRKALSGSFDIVLMDIQMPEMDGYTATKKLRTEGYRQPIIALTAHAMNEVGQKCLNAGYSAHLPKPINSIELVSTIVSFLPCQRATL